MELLKRRGRESSIVLIGTFPPLILTPEWFIRNKLLPAEDADTQIALEVVVREVTRFRMSSVSVEITEERVVLRSDSREFDYLIRDLAVGIVTFLPETKVAALGLNVNEQIECFDIDFWHFIGDTFAPKELWKEALGISSHIGLKNIGFQVPKQDGSGAYNIGYMWAQKPCWAQFNFNDHYSVDVENKQGSKVKKSVVDESLDPLSILMGFWEQTLEAQDTYIGRILERLCQDYRNVKSR